MLQCVGRHSLANERRHPSVFLASVLAPAALFFVVKGDASQLTRPATTTPVAEQAPEIVEEPAAPCCVEIVASPVTGPEAARTIIQASAPNPPDSVVTAASRWRVVSPTLPEGIAPERGLQVRTILTARSISAVFPEIKHIGGHRQDALQWHPNGLAIDVMIPNPNSAAGIALGNAIVSYVFQNAGRFGIQDAIWRGVYYTPGGARPGGYGHYDHVHITTTGGGYPSGDELYFR